MTRPSNAARRSAAAAPLLRQLRLDHSRLSRAMREIEVQRARLRSHAAEAHPILVDAVRYLIDYMHGFHHPREDRLYSELAAAQPTLRWPLERLKAEHVHGVTHVRRLAEALRRLTPEQATGRAGSQVAEQLQAYVDETREHMRREEGAVFYADVGPLLPAAEWRRLERADFAEDPLADPAVLAGRYPALARELDEKIRTISSGTQLRTPAADGSALDRSVDAARQSVAALVETCGTLMHDGLDVVRANTASVLQAESPAAAVRAVPAIVERSFKFARQCVKLPSRVTLDSVHRILAPWAPADSRPKDG